MTLVAAYWEHGHPVLLGDLLLTRGIPTDGFCLPTLGDVSCTDGTRYVSSIQRKVVRISNQLCIGWTGAANDALREVGRLYAAFNTTRVVHRQELFNYVESLRNEQLELVLVGLFLDEEGLFTFEWNWQIPKFYYGWNYFCGSGRDYLDRYDEFNLLKTEVDLPENSNGIVEAVRKCTILLGDEVSSASTLELNFGGGIELATYIDAGIKFINGLGFVFFKCIYENGKLQSIDYFNNIILNQYFGDMLWICSVTKDKDNNPLTRIYGLPPFVGAYDKNISKPELIDFKPQTISFYFQVEGPQLPSQYIFVDVCYEPVNETTSFVITRSGIEIKFEPSFLENIENQIEEKLRNL